MKPTSVVGLGMNGLLAVLVGLLGLHVACEKKPNLAAAASSLAPTPPPPPGAMTKKFVVESTSKTTIEMDAPKERIRARTTGGTGTLDIDLTNIASSRGEVKMDLSTLTTSTFSDSEKNASQTTHARTWLEVGDGEDGKLDEKVKEANRYAVYAIRAIENPTATDVTKVPVAKEGDDDVRTIGLTTKGELLIHGHKVDRSAELDVKFHYDPGAPADRPKAISIATKTPLQVTIAEHDVKPRDGLGKIAKSAFHLLGTKVADDAYITLDIRVRPQT